jgi:hypothetical protein
MRDRGKVRTVLIAVALAVGFSCEGCWFSSPFPTPPPTPRIPTIAGVLDQREVTPTTTTYTLTDGRTVSWSWTDTDFLSVADAQAQRGNLALARLTPPKFIDFIVPMGSDHPGCWDAWARGGEGEFVWDMGGSILFDKGLELPKSATFHSDLAQRVVDGRKLWQFDSSNGTQICVTESGEVEWIAATGTHPRNS